MRIVIDLQGAQTGSRYRGIGRSATALAKAIIRNRGNHEILILLNGLFEDTLDAVKRDFSTSLPAENIVVFSIPSAVSARVTENAWRVEAAELVREWVIDALAPDVVLITSLFEGPVDPGVVSIRRLANATKTAVLLHDLIPFLDPAGLLANSLERKWYFSKIDSLRRADLLLAVSKSSRREAVDALGFDPNRVVTILAAADERFAKANISPEDSRMFLERVGIRRKFVMLTSKIETRKNFEGLIRAFGRLPLPVRAAHQLLIVGGHGPEQQIVLRRLASDSGLAPEDLVFAGHVSENDLITLYSLCTLFVLPSFQEGFGLPALEAMCCGAPVIGSNATSIPEVIGREDALFDPHFVGDMAALIERALTDAEFHESLRVHALQWSRRFSWDKSARRALSSIEDIAPLRSSTEATQDIAMLLKKIAAIRVGVFPERTDLVAIADSISKNEKVVSQSVHARSNNSDGIGIEIDRQPVAGENGDERYDATFIEELYNTFFNRPPDRDGFLDHLRALQAGVPPHKLVAGFLNSGEFALRWPLRRAAAGKPNSRTIPPSEPVIEVISHEVWLPDDRPRILLLKLDHIGDFVLTLDAFRLIRDTWPKADVTLVCGPWNQSIAEQSGLFDTVLCCNFYADTTNEQNRDISARLEEYRALPLGTYDIAVDLRCYDDNRVLLSHTDTKFRAGYAADGIELDLALPVGPEPGMRAHIGGRIMALASAVAWTFGTPTGGGRDGVLNGRAPIRHFKDGVVVGISPGTRNALRSWGRERFAELARILDRSGDYRFVLIGGNGDRADTQFIAESLPTAHVVDLAGTSAIADAPPVFAGLDLFIGGETGTTHIAALMGVPTLCIYSGVTNVDSWRPVGPRVVILRGNVSCSPCFLGTIEECRWGRRCMDISPARVAAEAIAMSEQSIAAARPRGVITRAGAPLAPAPLAS